MDLRSVLNTSDNGEAARSAKPHQPPPPHQHQHQHQQQQQPPPSRPSQSPAPYGGYRDFPPGPHPHQSPGRPASNDHTPSQQHPYPAQSPYQTPGTYPRAAPPPLQAVNSFQHDSRSPSGSMPAPSPSPYRQPPTPSGGQGAPREYPFPAQGHSETTSPIQRHQHPPSQHYQHQRQESYPQGPPAGPPGPYAQGQQHGIPQTPPVGTPGGAPQFPPHQRSHSTHSTPTPTSAHSQQHHGQAFHSPVSATQQQPPGAYHRQPSQPPTPGGGQPIAHPTASVRQSVSATLAEGPYKQPSSPYQQRNAPLNAPPSQTQPSPHMPSHPPPALHRSSTSHSAFGSPIAEAHPRPQYLREREQSLSVSPKTRVNPLPPNHAESHQHHHQQHQVPTSSDHDQRSTTYSQNMLIDPDRNVTPAKRKLMDRDISPQDMERKQPRTSQHEMNGQHHHSRATTVKSESPAAPRKKRLRRAVPPRWAQSVEILKGGLPKHPNYVLQKRKPAHLNGSRHSTSGSKQAHASRSRHASPEAARAQQPAPAVSQPEGPKDCLGQWEPSLTGLKPYEEVSKLVADFLFVNVINCQDFREIQSRGIQFEIEAKLGTVVDRRTNHRVDLGAASECLLEDTQIFKSSMSEENHKGFNDFLNELVVHAHPKRSGGSRVPVEYKHRREIDRFYDLTPELQNRLPACMRARFTNNKRPRVRVTHDQQSKELLGKIVKARVADIDLHMPKSVMDCRLSINLEMNWDGSLEELEGLQGTERQPDRNKDRLSYSQGHYQVDLTQVTQTTPQGVKKEHELEIELAPGILIDQGRKAMSGSQHRYPELIEGFIDNVRLLSRKARDV